MNTISNDAQLQITGGLSTTCGLAVGLAVGACFVPGGAFFVMANSEWIGMGIIGACA